VIDGCAGDVRPAMRVARHLDADESLERDGAQRGDGGRDVERALAERKMEMLALAHVLDLDVREIDGVLADRGGRVALAVAPDVSDVEREPQRRMTRRVAQSSPVGERRGMHARLGFERRDESAFLRLRRDEQRLLDKPAVERARVLARRGDAAPERDDLRAEIAADVHAADQHLDAPPTVGRIAVEKRRPVLLPRIEDEPRARLDAHVEPAPPQMRRDGRDLGRRREERIEVLDVGRQRDSVVAEVRDEVDRVGEPMVRESVGVVGETQARQAVEITRRAGDASDSNAVVTAPLSFVPGPTHVRDEILAAMSAPPVPHRSDAFRQIVGRVHRGLGLLLSTGSPVFPVLGSATAGVELALRAVARSRMLVVANGHFAERMAAIAASLGLDVETLSVPAGDPVDPALVARGLDVGNFDTVGFVHVETSTGAISNLDAIADVVRARPGVALVVDAVSALGGVEIAFDRLGPDAVLVASTGKALACPPGMAIVAASPGAVARARTSDRAGFALNLARLADFHGKGEVPYTPNAALFVALDRQLARVLAEGMPARAARHREMARRVQTWATERFAVLAREDARSPTVTAVENTRGLDVARLLAAVELRGFRIADGHGALAGATFRIGHMGDVTVAETEALLAALDEAVAEIA